MPRPTQVGNVKVNREGEIYFNERLVTFEELKREFTKLKQANGGVLYHPQNPLHPQAKAVRQAIIDAQLPINLNEEKLH